MNNTVAIKVTNLSKVFPLRNSRVDEDGVETNEHWALKDVSFEIKKGESVGIIGPNGSGKSTLLKILAGVTKPTSGKVEIRGKVASILDIGAGFHPELSGRENVYLNGQIHGFSKKEIESKFDEIVTFSGIEKFINEPVKNYSNGMYLRLAFSIMAHLDFDVYLFDEVFSVGDAEFGMKTKRKLQELLQSSKTVVFVSHNMVELNFQKEIIELSKGKLIAHTTQKDILMKYIEKNVVKNDINIARSAVEITDFSEFPVSPDIHLKSVRLHQNSETSFRTDFPFVLEIEYDISDDKNTYDAVLFISDVSGVNILGSTLVLSGKTNLFKEKGRYRTICNIPPSFFNSHIYVIDIRFVRNIGVLTSKAKMEISDMETALESYGLEISFPGIITFSAEVRTPNVDFSDLNMEMGGLLMPSFEWSQSKIDND